ncbi:MAG: hypothetical protein N4Q64_01765 [Lactobacillus iners]|nr:hypothetical protein [Lactobacillus iners]
MENLHDFMCIYMYKLEEDLKNHKDDLINISFQSDEANTDRPLKEYLKKHIEESFPSIPQNTNIESLCFEGIDFTDMQSIKPLKINRVLLPEDISDELKEKIKSSKSSVYTNPDLYLEIKFNDEISYESIELKTTKKGAIPGSSIQQIVPEEWTIFIKHSGEKIDISTGQYIHAINSKMQFPDRSPRPQVSFDTISTWNKNNRILESNALYYKKDDDDQTKKALISDWQGVLSQRWIDILFNTTSTKSNEPWFNNNLRKFILSFLKKYESLSDEQKKEFKKKVQSLITSD